MGALLPLLGTDFDMAQQSVCEDILYDWLCFELATCIPQTTRKITRSSRSNTAAAYGDKQHAAAAAGGGMGPALDRGGTRRGKSSRKAEKVTRRNRDVGDAGSQHSCQCVVFDTTVRLSSARSSVENGFPVSTQLRISYLSGLSQSKLTQKL
jgi:hypothetical protein